MSQPSKRRRFLQSSEIAELFLDTDSGDASDASSVKGGPEDVQGVSHTQPYCQTASSPESSSSTSSSASDEDEAVESMPGEQTQQPVTLQWTSPSCRQSSVAHTYTGGPRGKEDNEVSHINDGSSPLSAFLLYFSEIITPLVVETNRYYHDCLDRLDDGPSPDPDVTEAEMFCVSGIDNTDGTWRKRQTDRLLVNIGSGIHTFLRYCDEPGQIPSHPSLLIFY